MNLQALEAELRRIERRRRTLERRYEAQKSQQFTALPKKVGLRSVDALILSLAPYASPRLKSRVGVDEGTRQGATGVSHIRRGPGTPPDTTAARTARGRGAARRGRPPRHTEETKNAIRRALKKSAASSAALARQYGVSRSSIKDWKRQWGLTKPRKKK